MTNNRRENPLNRRIRKLIRNEMENVQRKQNDILRLHYITDRRYKVSFRCFWLLLLGLNFSLLFYQLYDRIHYYLSEPTTVITNIEKTVKMKILPNLILCSGLTKRAVKQFNNCLELPEFPDIENFKEDSSFMWELYDNADDIELIYNQENIKPKMSLTKVPHLTGMCTSFNIGDRNDNFLQYFKIRIESPQCENISDANKGGMLLIQDFGPAGIQMPIFFSGNAKWHIVFHKLIQLKYSNTRRKPCVDEGTHNECLETVLTNAYDSLNLSCRYPYMPSYKNIPFCPLDRSYNDFGHVDYFWTPRLFLFQSNCTQKCTEILIFGQKYMRGNLFQWTELTFEAPEIELFTELLAYNKISFLCDTGGLLGLSFGWSILSIILLPIEWQQNKLKMKRSMKRISKDLIKEKVIKLFNEEMDKKECKRKIFKNRFNQELFQHIFNRIKRNIFFSLVMIFLTVPLLGNCIYNHFFFLPVTRAIDVLMRENISTPVSTICLYSDNITLLKNEFSTQVNGTCEFTLLDLLNKPPRNLTFTLKELWAISSEPSNLFFPPCIQSTVAMENGNCARLECPDLPFVNALIFRIEKYKRVRDVCNNMVGKFYLSSEEYFDDILVEGDLTLSSQFLNTFKIQYKYLNTTKNVCTDNIEYVKCREDCRRAATEQLICRLPYMTNLNKIPDCSSTQTAYYSRLKYLKMVDKCPCRKKCLHTVYDFFMNEDVTLTESHFFFALKQTNNRVIAIEEHFSYPFIKLLADVGNVLGITIGISIMSFIVYCIECVLSLHRGKQKYFNVLNNYKSLPKK